MAAVFIDLVLGWFLLVPQRGGEDSIASWIATGVFWAVLLAQVVRR